MKVKRIWWDRSALIFGKKVRSYADIWDRVFVTDKMSSVIIPEVGVSQLCLRHKKTCVARVK